MPVRIWSSLPSPRSTGETTTGRRPRAAAGAERPRPRRRGAAPPPPPPAAPPPWDPVYLAKNAFIEKHGLVVFRLNQHWRLRRPDPFATGLASALGWRERVEAPGEALRYA